MNLNLVSISAKKKLECAVHNLLSGDATLSNISFKYGFDSQQSFSRSFSSKYKMPPGKFRGR
ncbi:TPA: helix-turn-helix domain-containing protein [Salmonella enterica]